MTDSPETSGARPGARPPWTELRAELEALGFRPTKTLGQNFLLDPNAARALAADAELAAGETVLEVGAGCGFLTAELAALGLDVLAVEIDARLLGVAKRLLAERPNVRWLHADALAGKHALAPELERALPARGPWSVVANLPYAISAPLLVLLARRASPPRRMSVLVQEELALRIAAHPGAPEWGALSARLQLRYRAQLGRTLDGRLFWPRPRVASRIVRLDLRPGDAPDPGRTGEYDALVDVLFQRRRKQLVAALAARLGRRAAEEALGEAGLDGRRRPAELSVDELERLARTAALPAGRPADPGSPAPE